MSDNFQAVPQMPPLQLSDLGVPSENIPVINNASSESPSIQGDNSNMGLTVNSSPNNKPGRKSIPVSLLQERRDYVVALKLAGLSMSSILKQVNHMAASKNWGVITQYTIERELADYYSKNRVLDYHDQQHNENLRRAYIDQMEKTIEKLSFHIADKKKKWKPFEYISALTELYKMQMAFLEAQNWNKGRPAITNIQNNFTTNVFEQAAQDLQHNAPPDAIDNLNNLFGEALAKMEEDRDIIVLDAESDV